MRSAVRLRSGHVSYLAFLPEATRPPTIGPAVLLLHGGGTDSAALSWGQVGPRLAAAGYQVIAPDHPGHGLSALPAWRVTQHTLVDYVTEFVGTLGLDRYVIGGLSLGGGLAIGHALQRPEPVVAVLLLDSYGLMPRLGGLRQPVAWVMQQTGLLNVSTRWMTMNRRFLAWNLARLIRDPARRTPDLVDEIIATARRSGFAAFEQWQRDELRWNRLRTNYTPQLAVFGHPTLLIHGERDAGVPLRWARRAAALIPDAELEVIAEAGHWVQRDQPDAVAAAIVNFLHRRVRPADPPA